MHQSARKSSTNHDIFRGSSSEGSSSEGSRHRVCIRSGRRMDPRCPPTRPETAAELLDLLLRSRWFADSLFGQLLDQSALYLDRPAREFAIALVEKRCLSSWQAEELLAGRNQFYLRGYRLIDRITEGQVSHFVAEQIRPARLVILEVEQTDGRFTEQAFEFDGGWLLSQRLANRQFHRDLLNRWQLQIEELRSALDSPLWETANSHRLIVGEDETVRFLKPIGPQDRDRSYRRSCELPATEPLGQRLELAREQLDSVLWSPGAATTPLHRTRYLPLLRKGPPWKANDVLPAELLWMAPEPAATPPPLECVPTPEAVPPEVIATVQKAELPAIVSSQRNAAQRRIAPIMLAATAATILAAAVGWIGGRTWASRVRAMEESQQPQEPAASGKASSAPPHSANPPS